MNRDQAEGNRKRFKDKVRETWGKFTDDESDALHGFKREPALGFSHKMSRIVA